MLVHYALWLQKGRKALICWKAVLVGELVGGVNVPVEIVHVK
jgi:hypothetical protein